jgi:hypothetical protein
MHTLTRARTHARTRALRVREGSARRLAGGGKRLRHFRPCLPPHKKNIFIFIYCRQCGGYNTRQRQPRHCHLPLPRSSCRSIAFQAAVVIHTERERQTDRHRHRQTETQAHTHTHAHIPRSVARWQAAFVQCYFYYGVSKRDQDPLLSACAVKDWCLHPLTQGLSLARSLARSLPPSLSLSRALSLARARALSLSLSPSPPPFTHTHTGGNLGLNHIPQFGSGAERQGGGEVEEDDDGVWVRERE